MTINKLTSKLTVKHDLAVLLQHLSSHFFLFQQNAYRLYFLVKAEILGLTWSMMLMWKSPCVTKVIQSFLQCRRSCIWQLHLVKSYSKENSGAIFQQLHVCLPQRAEASGSEYGQELCYHSGLFQQEKLINL